MNPLQSHLDLYARVTEEQSELLRVLDHYTLQRSEWILRREGKTVRRRVKGNGEETFLERVGETLARPPVLLGL